MPHDDLIKCRILEGELQTFWPDWHVVCLISGGSFADVFKIRTNEFGVEFTSALKVLRHRDGEIRLETADLLNPAGENQDGNRQEPSFPAAGQNRKDGRLQKNGLEDTMPEVFRNEIRILEMLRGAPNVVNMEGLYYKKEGREHVLYIRMELLTSLRELIDRNRTFSVREIIQIGKDICFALTCCEERHIIHRDIKPGNLFLDKYGTCKVGDFGVSRRMETVHVAHTMTGIGTISYMAPEIYRQQPYNNTVDLYALGLVLYQLLNRGRMPFMPSFPENFTTADIDESNYLRLHGREIPSLLGTQGSMLRRENAEDLDHIIRKACAFQPRDRYQTAEEMEAALENCIRKGAAGDTGESKKNLRADAGEEMVTSVLAGKDPFPADPGCREQAGGPTGDSPRQDLPSQNQGKGKADHPKTSQRPRNAAPSPGRTLQKGEALAKKAAIVITAALLLLVLGLVIRRGNVQAGVQADGWAQVIEASEDGSYEELYEIGDTLPLDLGEEGTVTMVLVAKDADELADGSGRAHMTWIAQKALKNEHRMYPSYDFEREKNGTGALGGWRDSEMRAYLTETIRPLLPQELQDAVKAVKKYSEVYNREIEKWEAQETVDAIWIPSLTEVFGFSERGLEESEAGGATYVTSFEDPETRIKSRTDVSSASSWWLRSANTSGNFYYVDIGGSSYYNYATNEGGVVVGFCL